MRYSAWVLLSLLAALPLHAALDFNAGSFGTVGISNDIFLFTPSGGTGPYVFLPEPATGTLLAGALAALCFRLRPRAKA